MASEAKQIIFIVGPTAAGKSETAYLLARRLKGEVISCDAMLIYKEPRVITAKASSHRLKEVPHHFINLISVEESYNAFEYYRSATEKIRRLYAQSIPAIVCGGSGLYFKVLLDGIFEGAAKDDDYRKALQARADKQGKEALYRELKEADPAAAERISPHDLRRIIRALEVYRLTGLPASLKRKEGKGLWGELSLRVFGLRLKRDALYQKINMRVEEMFEKGAVAEVKGLLGLKISLTAQKIIGLKEIGGYLSGKLSEDEAKDEMKKNTRHFAKRQITWFKREQRIEWLDIDGLSAEDIAGKILRRV